MAYLNSSTQCQVADCKKTLEIYFKELPKQQANFFLTCPHCKRQQSHVQNKACSIEEYTSTKAVEAKLIKTTSK